MGRLHPYGNLFFDSGVCFAIELLARGVIEGLILISKGGGLGVGTFLLQITPVRYDEFGVDGESVENGSEIHVVNHICTSNFAGKQRQ